MTDIGPFLRAPAVAAALAGQMIGFDPAAAGKIRWFTSHEQVARVLGWSVVTDPAYGAVAATSVRDASISAGSTSISSPGGGFRADMNGRQFYLRRGGPVLVGGPYAWEASPLVGTFTYVSPTQGTLSAPAVTAVAAGEIVIGPDASAAMNAAIARGSGYIPAGVDLVVTGEIVIGNGQALRGGGRRLSRIFSTTPKANVITSAWTTAPEVSDLSVHGNGYGAQPANVDPGTGVAPNWANSGCGAIFANVQRGLIERVDAYHCGGDAVTTDRNGIAGIYVTMGCVETQVVGCVTAYCRNGINEDNYFSGPGQLYNPLSNTFDRNTTDYCRFGMAIDSGSLSRGASITNPIARYNVINGIEVHSSNQVTILNPRCEFNGVGYAGNGIHIYGTSSTILANHVTVIGPQCHGNGAHGIKISDYVTNWKVAEGHLNRNFRHGLYVNNEANDGLIADVSVRNNGQGTDAPGTYDGVRITSSRRIDVRIQAYDDQATPTQNWGVRADGTSDAISINDASLFGGNAAGPVKITGPNSRVSARTRASVLAKAQGFAGESFPRSVSPGSFTPAAGDQRAILVGLLVGETVTSLFHHVTVAASGLTLAKLGIWDASGNLLASTADVSAQFAALGVKGGALTAPWTCPADGGYYLGAVFVGGTPPALLRGTSGITGYTGQPFGVGAPPSIASTGKTDITSMGIGASGNAPWVGWI